MTRDDRLTELNKLPSLAALDHRLFLDENGRDSRIERETRHVRRRLEAESKRLAGKYNQILITLRDGGARFPTDQFLRSLAIEYTHRYASSGAMTQPASFNYFEAFCKIGLIDKSIAPYATLRDEYNHLFNVPDFFDFITSGEGAAFKVSDLLVLPEEIIYNFTQNGRLADFTYLNTQGREFLISGFSMIRHGAALHWSMIGGEVLSEDDLAELKEFGASEVAHDMSSTPAHKKPFLEASIRERGNTPGGPVFLEAAANAQRTVIAGEFDLLTGKHQARCYMRETENSYNLVTDDPDIFYFMRDTKRRDEMLSNMSAHLDTAGVMWNLAEAFFQLPRYFEHRMTISEAIVASSGLPKPKAKKGGRGLITDFKHVTSLEVNDEQPSVLVQYTPPPFQVETEGYWHRLESKAFGSDREGKPVRGRDWIKTDIAWRAKPTEGNTVFVKSTLGSAKLAIADYVKAASEVAERDENAETGKPGVLYVMRCIAMQDEIYKVGWTSKTAGERAKELSTTGVPVPFEVVHSWNHVDPAALEKSVHASLDPYRVAGNREFFKMNYSTLRDLIELEISRGLKP